MVHGGTWFNDQDINDYITALKYNPGSSTGELSTFWQLKHDDSSGATGITLFDFNQDGISELVYRDNNYLRIINGSLIDHTDGVTPVTDPYDLASYICTSATCFEYPVVADINNDGQAEIIVVGGNVLNSHPGSGTLRIFKAGDGSSWAPARPVWNQFSYNAVYVNKDLTILAKPMNPATVFPGSGSGVVRPFNNFLKQQTTLNHYGTPLWLAPNGQIVGTPVFSYNEADDKMAVTVQVKNVGDAIFQSPFYVTVYKNNIGGSPKETYTYPATIGIDETVTLTFSISGFSNWAPYNFLILKINDSGNGTTDQDVCDDSKSQYRYCGILPTQQEACKDNIATMTCIFSLFGNDTYQWQYSINDITWTDISGATSKTYKPAYQEQGTGYYRVVVTNENKDETVESTSVRIISRRCVMPVNPNTHLHK